MLPTLESYEEYVRPKLIFDLFGMEKDLREVTKMLKKLNIYVIFPVKAFPVKKVLKLFMKYGSGFDVSNEKELEMITKLGRGYSSIEIISFCGPLVHKIDYRLLLQFYSKIIIDFDSYEQYLLVKDNSYLKNCILGARVGDDAMSYNGDNYMEYLGWRRKEILNNYLKELSSLHFHTACEKDDRFNKKIKVMLENYSHLNYKYLNLGGGYEKLSKEQLVKLLTKFRSYVKEDVDILIEMGEFWSCNHGYLVCSVLYTKICGSMKIVFLDIVRGGHLKWSKPAFLKKLSTKMENTTKKENQQVIFVGSSCYQEIVCKYGGEVDFFSGDILLFSGINGYSVAWNNTFNGIEKIEVEYNGS